MKDTINLFSTDLLPTYPWYHTKHFTRLVFVSLLLMALSIAAVQAYLHELQQQTLHYQQAIDNMTGKNNQIRQDIEVFLQTHEDKTIFTSQKKIESYQAILEQVKQVQTHNDLRLYPLLHSLATIKNMNLWLTSIEISLPQIVFKGVVLNPESLPSWVEAIKKHNAFKNYKFSHVKMEAINEQQQVQFIVILSRLKP